MNSIHTAFSGHVFRLPIICGSVKPKRMHVAITFSCCAQLFPISWQLDLLHVYVYTNLGNLKLSWPRHRIATAFCKEQLTRSLALLGVSQYSPHAHAGCSILELELPCAQSVCNIWRPKPFHLQLLCAACWSQRDLSTVSYDMDVILLVLWACGCSRL